LASLFLRAKAATAFSAS